MNDRERDTRLHEECCSKEGNPNVSEIYLKIKEEKESDSTQRGGDEFSPLVSPSKTEESVGESIPNIQRKTSICKTAFGLSREEYHVLDGKQRKAKVPKEIYTKEEDHVDEENMNWVEIKRERVEEDSDSDTSFDPLSTCEENSLEFHQRESYIVDNENTDTRMPEGAFVKEEDCSQSENCTEIKRECFDDSDTNYMEFKKENSDDSDATSDSQSVSPSPLPLQISLDEPVSKGQKKKVSCEVCNKIFTTSNIKAHMRVHTKEKPFICEICNKAYSQKSTLKTHRQTHSEEKPYTCEICNKAFAVSLYLRTHMVTHSDEKPFICDICNKAFSRKEVLLEHRRIHTKEKRFSCDICNGTFTQKTSLSNHMEVHIEEKTLFCDLCDKAFALRSTLLRHKRMHRSERTFTCDLCNKSFFQKGALKEHVRSHTKPFKCDVCNKGFSRRNLYMRHSKVHSKETI